MSELAMKKNIAIQNKSLKSFINCSRMSLWFVTRVNTTCVTFGTGTAYISGAYEFIPTFLLDLKFLGSVL